MPGRQRIIDEDQKLELLQRMEAGETEGKTNLIVLDRSCTEISSPVLEVVAGVPDLVMMPSRDEASDRPPLQDRPVGGDDAEFVKVRIHKARTMRGCRDPRSQ